MTLVSFTTTLTMISYYDPFHETFFIAALLGARFRSADTSLLPEDGVEGNGPLDIPAGCNMGRRRSRAVLYQLSGHYKPEKIKTKLKLNNVSWQTLFNAYINKLHRSYSSISYNTSL